ncbi:MAG: hypothetical protein P8O16_06580 [Algoriphagus sp.]|uniref:hypothetical protein n=1 Tax=Algoriphagus sp. TaxID=1872435 RepID=UPI0026397CD3|nr:hypothetical protein [Algoriphagus sp.]MDG1276931.1 hypothetical protein [Algoriphagus sp.]
MAKLGEGILHPIDQAIAYWVSKNSLYKEFFYQRKFVSHLVNLVKLCPFGMKFFEDQSESFIDGLVVFSKGYSRNIPSSMQLGEDLMKPMMDKVIGYLSSESFQKFVLSQHISGDERVPVKIPEIFITVNELILFLRRENSIVFEIGGINKLKQDYVLDKIDGWGLNGEFGEKIKKLESILYPNIFNPNGFLTFDLIFRDQKQSGKGVQSDIVYFYHRLKNDGLIHAKVEVFKTWFERMYPEFPLIERFHSLDRIKGTFERKERYSSALNIIKSKEV